MARLDPIVSQLFSQQGLAAVFEAGQLPVLRLDQDRSLTLKQALGPEQIITLFNELLPADRRAGFPAEGVSRWSYEAAPGTVYVRFEKKGPLVRAVIRRAPEEGPPAGSKPPAPDRTKTPPGGTRAATIPVEKGPSGPLGRGTPPEQAAHAPPEVEGGAGLRRLHLVGTAEDRPTVLPGDPAEAMQALLRVMLKRGASDLHLTSLCPPMLRVDGDMRSEPGLKPVSPELMRQMLWSITPEKSRAEWETRHDADFAYELEEARFRVNLFADRNGIGAVLRQIPSTVLTAEQLGLAQPLLDLCALSKGLVLVTGPTGSGKSTTLAAMIDHVNRTRADHIITIEDPIEFVHKSQKCLVNQREVGTHTGSFKDALRAALREDPDVVLVGEMRDLETISIALETAETGHLVFGTLHTNTAPSTIDRIIDQFPSDRQQQVRLMLSESLRGVVSQTLCKKIGGGRVAAQEVLIGTPSLSNMIREGKTFQIPSAMQTGRSLGMCTLNEALMDLVRRRVIEKDEALRRAVARAELKSQLEKLGELEDVAAA